MRQYRIFYKGAGAEQFATLQPGAHKAVYDRPEVAEAIAIMRDKPHLQGVALAIGGEQFNVIAFEQPAEAPNSFQFVPLAPAEDFVGRASEM